MNKRNTITARVLASAVIEEREFLAYAAPDLLRALLVSCPAAMVWAKEHMPEQTEAVLLSLGTALELESIRACELAPCAPELS